MLVLVNDKKIMGKYTNGLILNVIAWVTSVVMIGLTLLLIIRSF
jgi:Mn2+/Fe2+ NRAMP family transporter